MWYTEICMKDRNKLDRIGLDWIGLDLDRITEGFTDVVHGKLHEGSE
jgi:hypothetical protein